ncbi:MAG: hypothetical protein QM802_13600 [Agriterribacter sp.]
MGILNRCMQHYIPLIFLICFFSLSAFAQNAGNWNFNNTLAGTGGSNNTVSAASLSSAIGSGAYNGGTVYYGEDGWPTGTINTGAYLEFTLTPNAGYTLNLTSIDLNMRRSTTGSPAGSGPRQWSIRSSLDGYTADLGSGTLTQNTTPTVTVSLSGFTNVATAITFRIYGYDVYNNPGGLNRFVFDNITVKGLSILPISFTAFTGNISGNSSILNWEIAANDNLNYFDVERSVDGTSFTSIGKVYASNSSSTYSYSDKSLSQQSSQVFYRVKSVEFNNAITYSSIIKLALQKNSGLNINSIVSSGSGIIAQVTTDVAGSAKILVTTLDGKTIQQQNTSLTKGTQLVKINNNAITGIYVLTVMQNGQLKSRQFRN